MKNLVDGVSKSLPNLKNYLVDKLGYHHKTHLDKGLKLYENWGLISSNQTDATRFLCQATRARNGNKLKECNSYDHTVMLPKVTVTPLTSE